jgi:hypothetical protein
MSASTCSLSSCASVIATFMRLGGTAVAWVIFGSEIQFLPAALLAVFDAAYRSWNLPVHNFFVVHVQQPVKALGINRTAAMLGIFVVSAALHEVVLSVPFKAFKLWAFWGMIGQVPIIIASRAFRHHKVLGNIIFWSCFAIGQSVIVLMYFSPAQFSLYLSQRACAAGITSPTRSAWSPDHTKVLLICTRSFSFDQVKL